MKTKIIYISGDEVFDMRDIRAAFEEVRNALNLDKSTVLFGVPVDADDACLSTTEKNETIIETAPVIDKEPEIVEPIIDEETIKEIPEQESEEIIEEVVEETTLVEKPKKRGRPRKEQIVEEVVEPESESEIINEADEKVVPILSILSTNDKVEEVAEDSTPENVEIISEISDDADTESVEIPETVEDSAGEKIVDTADEDEGDLEKLLSAMTPLDIVEEKQIEEPAQEIKNEDEDISVDATLEQLATEFAETQDKIASENKSSSRSKIGKLRNILPFKQSKHKDTGLGDLFGWAGIAANDEDFSVPGFFTNAVGKK